MTVRTTQKTEPQTTNTKDELKASANLETWLKKITRIHNRIHNHKPIPKKKQKFEKFYDYNREYVEKNLIAYIGNKRRLLDLIVAGVKEVETSGSLPVNRNGLFVDFFAGTGVVSRLMKSLGFNVIANDWEHYSYCLNRGFLESCERDLDLFEDEGGIDKVLKEINGLTKEIPGDAYISRYYCPQDDNAPDPEHERLYYTRQNGILIDNIRSAIDRRYGNSPAEEKKKDLLLALLLVQGSKRSNTSGVFKAFHNGFGGKKQDALTRILSPVALERPRLSDQRNHSTASCYDALELAKLLKNTPAEVVYLDPPYNQHQYGSNYHLLNTIAHNDRPQVNRNFWINGKKINKGAIRKDWSLTRSEFCYFKTACQKFTQLINNINSKYLLVSYSSEGVIPLDDMIQILATKGKVGILTQSYVRYRGGRQANHTQNRNLEFILMVDTHLRSTAKDIENVKGVFLSGSLQNLFCDFIPVHELGDHKAELFLTPCEEGFSLTISGLPNHPGFTVKINYRLRVEEEDIARIRKLSFSEQQRIIHLFSTISKRPNHVKAIQLHDILIASKKNGSDYKNLDHLFLYREFQRYFRKVNFRKDPELQAPLNKIWESLKERFVTPSR